MMNAIAYLLGLIIMLPLLIFIAGMFVVAIASMLAVAAPIIIVVGGIWLLVLIF